MSETRAGGQLESNARKPAALSVWWDAFSKCSMAAKIPYQIRWRIMMLALDCEVLKQQWSHTNMPDVHIQCSRICPCTGLHISAVQTRV